MTRLIGFNDVGQPVYETTCTSRLPAPESTEEWIARRRNALQNLTWMPAVAAGFELVEGADVRKTGKALTADDRYHVGLLLGEWQTNRCS